MMKTAVVAAGVLMVAGIVAAAAQERAAAKPQGMSLRLELFVSEVEKSAEFYTKVLGFERMEGDSKYLPVRSGLVVVGLGPASGLPKKHYFNPELQTGRKGLGAEIVLEVDDVKALYGKVQAADPKAVVAPLRRQSWGLTDFRVVDPDGYYLRLTSR
jgi:catechol 2,3-dioxygenase-like lactoylglutathione lyase family enzyme